jgi:hypothetical protein
VGIDLFKVFHDMVRNDLVPWLREFGFEGEGRDFHLPLPAGNTLLLVLKTSKGNRRDSPKFDFVLEGYIRNESGWVTWFWESFDDGQRASSSSDGSWESLTELSDPQAIADNLKQMTKQRLVPAARHAATHPGEPPIAGHRLNATTA